MVERRSGAGSRCSWRWKVPNDLPSLSDVEFDALEQRIYERSKAEALAASVDDYLSDGNDTWWIAVGTRGQARAFFAGEYGCDFTAVSARRVYMAVDLQAIRDRAHDIVVDVTQGYEDLEDAENHIAHTWDDEGWLWSHVAKDHPRAIPLWECTERSR